MRIYMGVVIVVVLTFSLVFAGSAMAQQQGSCENLILSVTPGSGVAGSSASVSGYGAMPNDSYELYWDATGGTPLATGNTDSGGNISTTVTIPMDATIGAHSVIFVGYNPQEQSLECPQPFTVIAATAQEGVQPDAYTALSALPSTGLGLAVPVAGFLLSGTVLLAWRRRS